MQPIPSFDVNYLIENTPDGVYITDMSRVITFWNKAAERITGFSAAEVIGKKCSDNILTHVNGSGISLCKAMCTMGECMLVNQPRDAEVFLHHKSGHRIPVLVRTIPLRDGRGAVIGGIEFFTDISNLTTMQQRISELEHLALIDNLTKLSNRHHTMPSLEAVFKEKERYDLSFGVMMMDIDDFKSTNDTRGHDTGDAVLVMVAGTLQNAMRPFDHLGRWGGEEFLGIIRSVDEKALLAMANRCRSLVEQSYLTIKNETLRVTLSIGATIAAPEDTAETIIKRADRLLYESKKKGKNRVTTG